jgi:hypothetical protein
MMPSSSASLALTPKRGSFIVRAKGHVDKRIKVGTVFDPQIYQNLKERALLEHRTISDVLNSAVAAYTRSLSPEFSARKAAFERMMSHAIPIDPKDLQEIMEADIYES